MTQTIAAGPFAGPYLELFSRTDRPGWTSWGHEAGKFGGAGGIAATETAPNSSVGGGGA